MALFVYFKLVKLVQHLNNEINNLNDIIKYLKMLKYYIANFEYKSAQNMNLPLPKLDWGCCALGLPSHKDRHK